MKPKIMLEQKYGRKFLYQWDINMRLELENIPPGTQIDFDNVGDENAGALPILTYEEDGAVYADIPNKLLMSPGTLVVYAYLFDAERGYTKLKKSFVVIKRSKPENYVYSETKVMTWNQLDERIKALEKGGGGGCDCDSGGSEGDNAVEFDSTGTGGGSSEDGETAVEF